MTMIIVTLVLVLFIKDTSLTSAECNRLYLKGLENDAHSPWLSYAGVYVHSEPSFDISPSAVYRHEKHQHVQFLYKSTFKRLFLMDNGSVIVAAITNGWNTQPLSSNPFSDMIMEWMSYNIATDTFKPMGKSFIQPTCVDEDFFQCDSGSVKLNADIQVTINSSFQANVTRFNQIIGLYSDLRPVFNANVDDSVIYLYYLDNNWVIGQDYQATDAIVRSYDSALRPEFVTNNWYILKKNTWSLMKSLKFQCVGLSDKEVCNEAKCQNGGTCEVVNERYSFCRCSVGFYGLTCENKKPKCSSHDLSMQDRKYRNLHNFDGSIMVWFCDEGYFPHQGFAVCQLDKWSANTSCKLTIGRNMGGDPRVTEFLIQHYWTILALLIVMCIGQVYFPCQIFCCVLTCRSVCSETKTSQAKAKEQIIAQFRRELNAFEYRHPSNNSPYFEYSSEASAELADIQQRLEKAVDVLKTKRRKMKRKDATAGCGRVTSCYDSFTFWFWVAYLALSRWYNLASYAYAFYLFNAFAITWLVLLALVIFFESCASSDHKYITKLSPIASVKSEIKQILAKPPTITMVAECYHYETRHDSDDSTRTDKVVTATIKESYVFHYWRNQSPSTLLDLHKKKVTKIKMQLDIEFGDAVTEKQFEECYARFQATNRHRDTHVEFSSSRQVPGFNSRMTTYGDTKPGWMRRRYYFLSTIFCVGWLYRAIFNSVAGKTDYKMKKLIYSTRPLFSDAMLYEAPPIENMTAADNQSLIKVSDDVPDSSLPPPPGYDTLYSVSNIKDILASLEKEGDNCDDIPLTLTNNSDYVNVRIETGEEVHVV